MPPISGLKLATLALTASLAVAVVAAARDSTTPDEWLERMSEAVESLDYKGTVLRQRNDDIQPLKIVHKKIDGVVNERIVVQEGNGLEVIRIGDEVHCILPDKKSVLIEKWENASTLFSTVPSSPIEPGAQYDVLILSRNERVAGRTAVEIAIRPNDGYRFEHRYLLDKETGFPLQTELVNLEGKVVDKLKFADIELDGQIASNSLAPSISLDSFTWYAHEPVKPQELVETDWTSSDLPPGFRAVSVTESAMDGAAAPVTQIVFSDGLAKVSVFVSAMDIKLESAIEIHGVSSSYMTRVDDHVITAVGEVPPATLEQIATSMQKR